MQHSYFLVLLRSSEDPAPDRASIQRVFERPASAVSAVIHEVTDDTQLGIDHSRSNRTVAAFIEIVFGDERSLAAAREACDRVRDAVAEFHPSLVAIECAKNVVVPLAEDVAGPVVKRMSLLEKQHDIDSTRFRHEWTGKHAEDVPHLPHLIAYTQNVTERSATPDHAGIDGIVELWFPSSEHIVEAFASDQARITQGHALEFIQTITTFLVSSHDV